MTDLFFSFGNQHPGQLVLNNFPRFMQELSIPGNPVFDMGAIDILRARERGVPRYNEFRRQLGLNPIRTFDDLTDDKDTVADAHRGLRRRRREPRPAGRHAGRGAAADRTSASARRCSRSSSSTPAAGCRPTASTPTTTARRCTREEGMQWVDDASLKTVILRHFPELAATGLGNVTNAFEPWDTDTWLDPLRHPAPRLPARAQARPLARRRPPLSSTAEESPNACEWAPTPWASTSAPRGALDRCAAASSCSPPEPGHQSARKPSSSSSCS